MEIQYYKLYSKQGLFISSSDKLPRENMHEKTLIHVAQIDTFGTQIVHIQIANNLFTKLTTLTSVFNSLRLSPPASSAVV